MQKSFFKISAIFICLTILSSCSNLFLDQSSSITMEFEKDTIIELFSKVYINSRNISSFEDADIIVEIKGEYNNKVEKRLSSEFINGNDRIVVKFNKIPVGKSINVVVLIIGYNGSNTFNLYSGYSNEFKVTSGLNKVNINLNKMLSPQELPPNKPVKPTEPSPENDITISSVTLNWSEIEYANSYEVYFGTTSDSNTATKFETVFDTNSGLITGLEPNTQYYFWIKAINENGSSGFSDYITVATKEGELIGGLEIDEGQTAHNLDGYTANSGVQKIAYKINNNVIDVQGSTDGGTTWAQTVLGGGWAFNFHDNTASTPSSSNGTAEAFSDVGQIIDNVNYKIKPLIVSDPTSGNAYVIFQYTVTNIGESSVTVKFGSNADTKVGSNDSIPINFTEKGVQMTDTSPTNSYDFYFYLKNSPGVTDVSTIWAGGYSSRFTNQYVNNYVIGEAITGDTGMSYSWTDVTIPAGETVVKTVRLSLGAISE